MWFLRCLPITLPLLPITTAAGKGEEGSSFQVDCVKQHLRRRPWHVGLLCGHALRSADVAVGQQGRAGQALACRVPDGAAVRIVALKDGVHYHLQANVKGTQVEGSKRWQEGMGREQNMQCLQPTTLFSAVHVLRSHLSTSIPLARLVSISLPCPSPCRACGLAPGRAESTGRPPQTLQTRTSSSHACRRQRACATPLASTAPAGGRGKGRGREAGSAAR